jgi:hypothetical protein
MEIEPMRAAPQSLENAAYRDATTAACDRRANFRVMRDNVGLMTDRARPEGPIDAIGWRKTVVVTSRLWELGDKLSRVLGQHRDTPGNEKGAGDGNRTHGEGAAGTRKQADSCQC